MPALVEVGHQQSPVWKIQRFLPVAPGYDGGIETIWRVHEASSSGVEGAKSKRSVDSSLGRRGDTETE